MYFARFKMDGFMDKYADVAVFDTEAARDEWVNFEDQFTKDFGLDTKEDHDFDRIAITDDEALAIIDMSQLIPDSVNQHIRWFIRSNRIETRGYSPA